MRLVRFDIGIAGSGMDAFALFCFGSFSVQMLDCMLSVVAAIIWSPLWGRHCLGSGFRTSSVELASH